MVLRLTPRGVEGGGITVSSRVVLLPSIAEAASIEGSSMIVWSERRNKMVKLVQKDVLKSPFLLTL